MLAVTYLLRLKLMLKLHKPCFMFDGFAAFDENSFDVQWSTPE